MEAYKPKLKQPSRLLRNNQTDAEELLWKHLRRKQMCGLQFNRQKPLLNFIVNFYCSKAKLVIEIDGAQHFEEKHALQDNKRDLALQEIGLQVIRFDNRQILLETDNILEKIHSIVCEISPNPSLPKRGI
jgi:very-short-patch-repair endonuclease